MPLIDLNGLGHFKDRENAMIAENFAATKDYAAGDFCYFNGTLKKFKTAHAAGAWIGTDAEDAKLAHDVSDLKESTNDLKTALTWLGFNTATIDTTAYDTIIGTIQSDGSWNGGNGYKSALVTDIPKTLIATAKPDHNAYISFFYKKPTGWQTYFCDGETTRHTIPMNTTDTFTVPTDCKCIVVTVETNSLDYSPILIGKFYPNDTLNGLDSRVDKLEVVKSTPFTNVNRNLCLASIKTDIIANKIPYHRGFLFHKLQNNDNSLWYGADFNNVYEIGTVSFNTTLMRFAISPKDGRIIACERDTRNGIWVWDGETETHLNSFTTNPMAWLYNSGVDFINSGTDEYCIFAEYSSNPTSGTVFNVWRGKYPYTSASDWTVVKTEAYSDIVHFHQVKRDPWTNILYLTSGDLNSQSKWWYSTDYGATWTLLVSGSDTGWGNSLCRTINFIFTEDYIYWATDHGQSEHTLNRIQRDSQTGIIDLTTKEKLADLPALYATNSLCYVESPNGLFMYDRIDTESSTIFGGDITMKFWNFDTEQLEDIATLGLTENTWGGSRGKCYINYTNSKQTMPAMGFSIDTPCIFDLVCDNPANIGTIAYDVGSKTIHTVDY